MSDNNPSEVDPFGQIADEFVEAFRQGKNPSVEEFVCRYPQHADDIRDMLPALLLMEQAKTSDDSPGQPRPVQGSAAAPPLKQLGDYQILREVGRGGMGVVYEAQQLSLGRHVAIKVLPAHALLDARQLGRFRREARSAAKLHHTNIVPVFGVGEHDGLHYYVMQFIQGLGLDVVLHELCRLRQPRGKQAPTQGAAAEPTNLSRDISAVHVACGLLSGEFRQAKPVTSAREATPGNVAASLPAHAVAPSASVHLLGQSGGSTLSESSNQYWQSVARVGMQVADALAHAASQGVHHRDIKPSNLLLDDTGNVWVTDFGLAKAASDSDNLTHTGDIVGTLRYMAPERFDGQGDLRSDVYSLGLTLYEMLVLRPAFDQTERNKLVKEVMHGEPAPPRKLNASVPRDLETVVLKAIARDPAHRYQSPAEMAEDLKRFVEDRPVRARRITTAEQFWRWCRRNPLAASLLAGIVLVFLVGFAGVFWQWNEARRREREAVTARDEAKQSAKRAEEAATRANEQKRLAEDNRTKAEKAEKQATEERKRADNEAEATRQNYYYAQMHLAQQAWREHRGLSYMRELLANWFPKGESPDRRGWEWFYLNSLPYQNLRTLTSVGGSFRPSTVAWHVARKRLAEAAANGLIRIWDVKREQPALILHGPAPGVWWWGSGRWLAWDPEGGKLAAGGNDGTVHVWETGAGRELRILRGHKSSICSVAFSSNGKRLAAWARDGTIKIWDTDAGRLTADVVHPGGVSAGAWSPDDKLLASGHYDGTVTTSGTSGGDKIATLRGHTDAICDLAWSGDSARLVSTGGDFRANIWDVASGKIVVGPLRHSHGIASVAWEPKGQRLATGSVDESVKIWDASTGREALTLRGHLHTVNSLSWGPDGSLASGCADGSVKIWESLRNQEANVLPGHAVRATSVSWSPNGKRLASGGDDGKVRIWAPASRKEILTLKGHDEDQVIPQFGLIRSLAWSPDGTLLASGGLDGTVKVWETASGREVFALPADRGSIWAVAWSPDGTRLAAGSQDGTIWMVEGIRHTPKVRQFPAHQGRVRSLAWSPKGDRLASGGGDNLVKLWDPIRGAELARLQGHEYWVMEVAWSLDGKRLASASGDHLVMVWDAETGRRLTTMRGHNDWVDAVAWSPDGTRLASAGLDNSVRIWNPRTGGEAFVLRGHAGMFHDVSWNADGAQLAAASSDGQIWVWDATRGFERDTTARAWPYIERKLASGTARAEDRLAFAQFASDHKKFALAAQLWAEVLERIQGRDDYDQMQHRYNAARAAVLAAAGQSRNEPPLDGAAKVKLRRQALGWLKADLTVWRKLHESDSGEAPPNTARKPGDWKQDSALASIRDAAALAKLPADEQKAFAQLWADIDALDTIVLQLKTGAPPLLKTAALQAWFGQDKELAATCARALKAVSDTKDPTMAERVAKICSLRPSANQIHDAALVLARRAVELGEGHPYLVYFQMGLGMAEYRSGHYKAADAALRTASRIGNNHYHIFVTSAFYRAMSLFQQGKEAEARKLATEAAAKMKPLPADEREPLVGGDNADDLILWMAYKEAMALVKFDAAPPAKVKNDKKSSRPGTGAKQ